MRFWIDIKATLLLMLQGTRGCESAFQNHSSVLLGFADCLRVLSDHLQLLLVLRLALCFLLGPLLAQS